MTDALKEFYESTRPPSYEEVLQTVQTSQHDQLSESVYNLILAYWSQLFDIEKVREFGTQVGIHSGFTGLCSVFFQLQLIAYPMIHADKPIDQLTEEEARIKENLRVSQFTILRQGFTGVKEQSDDPIWIWNR
tara:strand:- start:34 stop:432 length:399 start_codon:yes stop_codon:yes gene_type:complete